MKIPVAHDFVCEWCWIGLFQTKRMREEFDVDIEWLGCELYPAGLEVSPRAPAETPPENKPLTPSRLTLAFAAAALEPVRRPRLNTHAAHEAVEFAKQFDVAGELVERIYYAYWKDGKDISDIETLATLATGLINDIDGMRRAIAGRKFARNIIQFNEGAHERGVWNLPTYWIGEERYAEQPWKRLESALQNRVAQKESQPDIYHNLDFPLSDAPDTRPYIAINMVATIDGKIVTGKRGEPVDDLGSKTDHLLMRRIEAGMEAVLIGAGAQRSTKKLWYPKELFRFVATQSGNILYDSRFFTDAPEKAFVVCPNSAKIPEGYQTVRAGNESIDWKEALKKVRAALGIRRLLVEGGSDINAQLLRQEIVDELFLTIAPKVKLGENVPTIAGGDPLPRQDVQKYRLLEQHAYGDEVFLRYRRV